MNPLRLLSAALLAALVGASALSVTTDATKSRLRTVHQFPNETWVENIAVRSNGNLIVTLITAPEVWEIDPFAPDASNARLIYQFPHAQSTLGIAEIGDDVFAINVGNFSLQTFSGTPGSWSVWELSLQDGVKAHKITDIPSATFLNGMTILPAAYQPTVLTCDSVHGVVYRVDTISGEHAVAIKEPDFKPNKTGVIQLGINGIHTYEQIGETYLYFTNSLRRPVLGRIPINPASGEAIRAVETILAVPTYPTNLGSQADDFVVDAEGNVMATTDPTNSLVQITPDGEATVLAGGINDAAIAGDTAAAFGRTARDGQTLYITTNGGLVYPPPGGIVGGKVVAFETSGDRQDGHAK